MVPHPPLMSTARAAARNQSVSALLGALWRMTCHGSRASAAFAVAIVIGLAVDAGTPTQAEPMHGIAMHGPPALPSGYPHFQHADPAAPKGGRITFASIGTFDSLNPFIVKGIAAADLRHWVFDSLMARNYSEPFALYGLIAESIETPDDRSWVEFRLRPEARFSDGTPVTAEDVVFSMETLRTKGRPNYRNTYGKIASVERPDERTIRFIFGAERDRELPLLIGLMPILPKHVYETRAFDETSLEPPVGSGAYAVAAVDAGKSITYQRNPDYWARDLPANVGRFNFDTIHYEYYRDEAARFEAFKKGLFDLNLEGNPTSWATGYDFPAFRDGRVVKSEFKRQTPAGMDAFVFNTRRPMFADRRVRQALTLLFDFEWINKNLFYGLYERTQSFFHGSELSSYGRPMDEREAALLSQHVDAVLPEVSDGTLTMPVSDGSGRNRGNLRKALALFKEAGYEVRDGALVNVETGEPFTFEFMTATRSQERLALAYAESLERAGITITVRQVDSAQYQQRLQTYDFDMFRRWYYASLSPGNEQSFYWGSASADIEGTRNYMGIRNPGVDAMIDALLAAREREDFVAAVRAMDRLLRSGYYVLPLFHPPVQWVAHWTRVRGPDTLSLDGYKIDTWWAAEAQ